jgi:hypothetical protein
MTTDEMRAIHRLLLAVDTYRKPVRHTVNLNNVRHDMRDMETRAADARAIREAELDAALAAVRALLT